MVKSRKGQNLVEVVLIMPLLIIILLGILEYALFQRNVAAVQDVATEAAVAASKHYVDLGSGPFAGAYVVGENPAVDAALDVVKSRGNSITGRNITLSYNDLGSAYGQRPLALYEFTSTQNTNYNGSTVPVVTVTIDYRDPMRDGVSTQFIYHYNLVLFGMRFVIPGINGGRAITLIPPDIQISSTQTRQYVHY